MLHFRNSTEKVNFISPLFQKIRNINCVWGTHFQPFNICLNPVCNCYGKLWTQKSPLENYALFCKKTIFCIFRPIGIHGTILLVICIKTCSQLHFQLPLKISLNCKTRSKVIEQGYFLSRILMGHQNGSSSHSSKFWWAIWNFDAPFEKKMMGPRNLNIYLTAK